MLLDSLRAIAFANLEIPGGSDGKDGELNKAGKREK